ncbi:MAG: hypothetical protein JWP01_3058 [Myxococcales bacterium]|nr:hypothetical protein [Myxococcales bacterium]
MAVQSPKETPMNRSRHLLALGLAIAAGIAAPGCTVRGSGYVGASTTPVVYQEPPQPQVEQVSSRPGYVFVRGRWDWQNGQWAWIGGRWERERAGYAWSEGRWERRGNSWHWIDGTWSASSSGSVDVSNASGGVVVTDSGPRHDGGHQGHQHGGFAGGSTAVDVSNASGGVVVTDSGPRNGGGATVSVSGGMYPTVAPPPPRAEQVQQRRGYVFVNGRWDWRNGNWAWVDGHWEREKANSVWLPGRWELQGNYYVWVEGRWGNR